MVQKTANLVLSTAGKKFNLCTALAIAFVALATQANSQSVGLEAAAIVNPDFTVSFAVPQLAANDVVTTQFSGSATAGNVQFEIPDKLFPPQDNLMFGTQNGGHYGLDKTQFVGCWFNPDPGINSLTGIPDLIGNYLVNQPILNLPNAPVTTSMPIYIHFNGTQTAASFNLIAAQGAVHIGLLKNNLPVVVPGVFGATLSPGLRGQASVSNPGGTVTSKPGFLVIRGCAFDTISVSIQSFDRAGSIGNLSFGKFSVKNANLTGSNLTCAGGSITVSGQISDPGSAFPNVNAVVFGPGFPSGKTTVHLTGPNSSGTWSGTTTVGSNTTDSSGTYSATIFPVDSSGNKLQDPSGGPVTDLETAVPKAALQPYDAPATIGNVKVTSAGSTCEKLTITAQVSFGCPGLQQTVSAFATTDGTLGGPLTGPDASGLYSLTVDVHLNTGQIPKTWIFNVTAGDTLSSTSKNTTPFLQAPDPGPTFQFFNFVDKATGASIHAGDSVSCLGITIFIPATAVPACDDGGIDSHVTLTYGNVSNGVTTSQPSNDVSLPLNSSNQSITWTIYVTATDGAGVLSTRSITITQPPYVAPSIPTVVGSPVFQPTISGALTCKGGMVTVKVAVMIGCLPNPSVTANLFSDSTVLDIPLAYGDADFVQTIQLLPSGSAMENGKATGATWFTGSVKVGPNKTDDFICFSATVKAADSVTTTDDVKVGFVLDHHRWIPNLNFTSGVLIHYGKYTVPTFATEPPCKIPAEFTHLVHLSRLVRKRLHASGFDSISYGSDGGPEDQFVEIARLRVILSTLNPAPASPRPGHAKVRVTKVGQAGSKPSSRKRSVAKTSGHKSKG